MLNAIVGWFAGVFGMVSIALQRCLALLIFLAVIAVIASIAFCVVQTS